jgi:glutamyl-tRNA synthetase
MSEVRVRFAPSPTGPLHIGGLRTALYNYLWAKKNQGTFVLRVEDTDQGRYVGGAENYILESLSWSGLTPDEGPIVGGKFGPYRQSERKDLYQKHIVSLLENGSAYYAFDTPEELVKMREDRAQAGEHSPKYDASIRLKMKNSLTMSSEEVESAIHSGHPYVIRLKIEPGRTVSFTDQVRDRVSFNTVELDDKVLIKADGMPTYHFANVVDDYEMRITHVIRGEEWLSSTGHHVLLYQAFGWQDVMPEFAHLPLILKPEGKGKLSKRDGAKFGIPVFPLQWNPGNDEQPYEGFREYGFLPDAMINFLAFLGWNPGGEKEIFNMSELIHAFDLESIGKSGARFDFDKALWFNQQYIIQGETDLLIPILQAALDKNGYSASESKIRKVCTLFQERIRTTQELWDACQYCFEPVAVYDSKAIKKKWKGKIVECYDQLLEAIARIDDFTAPHIEAEVKTYMEKNELGFGQVLPILRLALTGTMKGPSIFEVAAILDKEELLSRLKSAPVTFDLELN